MRKLILIDSPKEPRQRPTLAETSHDLKLLVRPLSKSDESIAGYLLRLANENRLHAMGDVLELLNVNYWIAIELGLIGIQRLAAGESGGRQPIFVARRAGDRSNSLKGRGMRTRICPICLSVNGYRRAEWDLPLTRTCVKHKIQLMEECDRCGRILHYKNMSLFRCACGRDFRLSPSFPASCWASTFHAQFTPWRSSGLNQLDCQTHVAKELATARLIKMILKLGNPKGVASVAQPLRHSTWLKHEEWQFIGSIVSDWPYAFKRFFGHTLGMIGALERANLRKSLRKASLPNIYEHVKQLMRIQRDTGRLQKSRSDAMSPAEGLVSLREFQSHAGLTHCVAKKLFNSGALERATIWVAGKNGGRRRWVAVEELHAVQHCRATTLAQNEAAQFLKCSDAYLSALNQTGYLRSVRYIHWSREVRYRVDDLAGLLTRLRLRATKLDGGIEDKVTLKDIRPRADSGRIRRAWTRLMDAIRRNEVPIFYLNNLDAGLGNFAVRRIDVARYGYNRNVKRT